MDERSDEKASFPGTSSLLLPQNLGTSMHARCQMAVTRVQSLNSAIIRDLACLWQRQSYSRNKHKFRLNPFRNKDIVVQLPRVNPFGNHLPITGKNTSTSEMLCFPHFSCESRAVSFKPAHNLEHDSPLVFTSPRSACAETRARRDRPARSSTPYS